MFVSFLILIPGMLHTSFVTPENVGLSTIYIIKRVMSVCMLPIAGRTAGPIKTKLGIGTHVDPRSVLVKVKVIIEFMTATPGEQQ